MTGSAVPDSFQKATSPPPILKPTRALSPAGNRGGGGASLALQALDDLIEEFDGTEVVTPAQGNDESTPSPPANVTAYGNASGYGNANGYGRQASFPLVPSMTGTRYGAALGGGGGAGAPAAAPLVPAMTGRQFGGGTPKCARCAKAVYFAEQVKAVGKTWHKACLRCSQCGHTLDTGRLVDREGDPFCRPCYGKVSPMRVRRIGGV